MDGFLREISMGNVNAIKRYLRENHHILFTKDRRKQNCLNIACLKGHAKIVGAILSYMADLQAQAEAGENVITMSDSSDDKYRK